MRRLCEAIRLAFLGAVALAVSPAPSAPISEWDWHLPGEVYKELDFTDRAQVDRAVKFFQQAVDAERSGRYKVTDIVPRYRNAAGEWRKVQVQGEASDGNESLLAYAVFMQGYARQQARDRNEAIRLYNEVLDIYPEQKFIAVPARYMLSCVRRELGDTRQADAELEAIVDDKAADGHKIFYNVVRSMASVRWRQGNVEEAADLWAKIVFAKNRPDWGLFWNSRSDLITALILMGRFDELGAAVLAGAGDERKKKVEFLAGNAKWMSEIDRYGHHGITQFLNAKYEKKPSERKRALEKIRKGYVSWLDGQADVFRGHDDGWEFALAQMRARYGVEKPDAILKRTKELERLVQASKPDVLNARARTLATELVSAGMKDGARAAAAMPKNTLYRLRLQYDIEYALGDSKAAAMYLQEFIGTQPPPPPEDLKRAKYDLAWFYRHRLNEPEKAIKIYQELDDPPRSLWELCDAYRAVGKKKESYTVLTEIASIFPDDAPNAVLRTAQWREADGEKEKAIALYRRLLSHPKWKQTGASSAAHQALERYGIATGGAMTNEVR